MSETSYDGWCTLHRARCEAAVDVCNTVQALVILSAMRDKGWLPSSATCAACSLSETEFRNALREGAVMYTKAEAFGGTYTTKGIELSLGKKT
jgi:hypothetical protein